MFDVCRSTRWNAINDVLPILDDRRILITPAEKRHATAADLLLSLKQPETHDLDDGNQHVVS